MEFHNLGGEHGVPDFKISPTVRQSAVLFTSEGRTVLQVSKTDTDQPELLDYINNYKRKKPGAVIQFVEKSKIVELGERSGYSENEEISATQSQIIDILNSAVQKRATDVHIRLGDNFCQVLFRIDRVLTPHIEINADKGERMITALYTTMCEGQNSPTFTISRPVEANVSDEFVAQLQLNGGRLATRPTQERAVIVIRLLNKRDKALSLSQLGMTKEQQEIVERVIAIPTGVIILSGPTNSGKSTLAQSMCEMATDADPGTHLITVEDPIENNIRGAVQTPLQVVNRSDPDAMGRAWADAISNLMRLDPDQMLIGEIRDYASATGAIAAAQTGHKVYTTLHTHFPIEIISRLKTLRVDEDLITDSSLIVCLMGQRLAPVLCSECKIKYTDGIHLVNNVDKKIIESYCEVESVYLSNPSGCQKCNHTGYKGMTGIYEIIETDADFMQLYHEQGKTKAYEYWYKNGGQTIVDNLIAGINKGLIDPVYAHRKVCNLDRDSRVFTKDARRIVKGVKS